MNKQTMPILLTLAVLAAALAPLTCFAQPASDQRPPSQEQGQALTDQQKATVKSILSKYNKSSLTAEGARAINDAFRAAGLRGGPGLRAAIEAAGFDPEAIRKLAPPPGGKGGRDEDGVSGQPNAEVRGQKSEGRSGGPKAGDSGPEAKGEGRKALDGQGGYSLEQAISDRAQLTTIAFDGLAFTTGDMACNTFLPPGKISDFFGFQYMRDIDAGELGHNTSFLTRIANNMLAILNDGQKQQLVSLAGEQEPGISELAYKRFPLIKAFSRLRDGDLPAGASGLSREAVKKYSTDIYALSCQLAYRRAQVLGGIISSFDATQKTALAKLVFGDSRTWPEIGDQVDKRSLSHEAHVAVMTYASELFSWYAGSVEADAYFCPEGHGTYFGAFYMKDKPAMGNPNYSVSTTITGNSGQQFLAALNDEQRKQVDGLVESQRQDLNDIVSTRRSISTLLRRFMTNESVDQQQVQTLARRYGELDGEISYLYATAFARVYKTLTSEQKSELAKLRGGVSSTSQGAFLYSQPVAMPAIPNTDFLFGK
jgi:Spy/CpxP family protein refolding chaperone